MAKGGGRRIPCWMHIPLQYPDGREIEPEKLERFLEMLDRQFLGSSPLGVIPGRWVSEGKTIKEPMLRVEVAVKKKDMATFEKIGRLIAREMEQEALYVVINPQSEVRFLYPDKDDEDESPPEAANQ